MKVSIVGASGYTGVELIRILSLHSEVEIVAVTSEKSAGKKISDIFPTLKNVCDLVLEPVDANSLADRSDLIFTALPHQEAMKVVPLFLAKNKKVIDLSADYRLHDFRVYEAWYTEHIDKENLPKAVYGLCEIHRDLIKKASLVANPGCYPTTVILALAPLLKAKLIDINSIIIDSASGVSGAGRSAKVDTLFCEVNEGFKPYGLAGSHRHIGEMEQELTKLSGNPTKITFTPHLIPMDRGMLSTIYATPLLEISKEKLNEIYEDFYLNERFVRVLKDSTPSTAFVRGSNFCDIAPFVDKRTGKLIIVSAIDNLVKGASGQAVQNMNIMCGFEESTALKGVGIFP